MADVRDEDFAAAYQTAEKCILHGNGLIDSVRRHGEAYLIPRLQELCRTLDGAEVTIFKVTSWHGMISSGPFGKSPETEATAHWLAWRFAHRLWGLIFLILQGECIDDYEEPTVGPGFDFQKDIVLRYCTKIAELVVKIEPLDYHYLRPYLRLERDKGQLEFRRHGGPCGAQTPVEVPVAAPPRPAPSPPASHPFSGGTLAFYEDRVELCGVDICSGARSKSARDVLEALAEKNRGGFVAYSAKDLAQKIDLKGGDSIAGMIRDLRKRISKALKEKAHVLCGAEEVVLSGGPGYRLAPCLSVQFAGPPKTRDQDHFAPGDDPDDVVKDDPNDPDSDDPDDTNAANRRREWILSELTAGRQPRAANVAERFQCAEITAKRDFQALKREGRIHLEGRGVPGPTL